LDLFLDFGVLSGFEISFLCLGMPSTQKIEGALLSRFDTVVCFFLPPTTIAAKNGDNE